MIAALAAAVLGFAAFVEDPWATARSLAARDPVQAARAATQALELGRPAPSPDEQRLAFDIALALLSRHALEDAAELQGALHARVGAPWSAHDLAQTLVRLGDTVGAEVVLAAAFERSPRSALLANARGLVALGRGDERTARRHLGTALRLGDAGARVTLARLELVRGRSESARTLFAAGMDAPEPTDWALRGWALSVLGTQAGRPARGAVPPGGS